MLANNIVCICITFVVVSEALVGNASALGHWKAQSEKNNRNDDDHRNLQVLQQGVPQCGTRTLSQKELAKVEADLGWWQRINGVCNATICPFQAGETTMNVSTVWHRIQTSSATGGITTQMISDSMTVLNNAFSSSIFTFSLVATTTTASDSYYTAVPGGSAEAAMKSTLRQGDESTLNIYSSGIDQNGLLGYATFPIDYASNPTLDGVVIGTQTAPGGTSSPFNEGDTLVHQVGHWLFLYHVFQGGCSGNGDFVDDTPPQLTATRGCPVGQDSCIGGGVDSIDNFMDYSDDSCMNTFTSGQIARMTVAWNTYRASGTPLPTGTIGPTTPAPTLATPAPTPAPTISCPSTQKSFQLLLSTDQFGGETTWTLTNTCTGSTVLSNGPYPSDTITSYTENYCITEGMYNFTVFDSFGDGFCCFYGNGGYQILYGGIFVGSGSVFSFMSSETFGSCPTPAPTAPPSPMPTTIASTPTPEPTPAPTGPTAPTASVAPTEAPTCFSAMATIPVQNQGPIDMPNLVHGDKILTANGYHTLYGFGHQDNHTETEFLQIHTQEYPNKPLEITSQHLLFVVGKSNAVPAFSIKPGDVLQSSQWPDGVMVKKVTTIYRNGLYAPVTTDGTVVVDGIVSSCYVALQDNSGEYVELRGGISLGISQHFFSHLALTPVRMACLGISANLCKSYDQDGLAYFAKIGYATARWADNLSLPAQVMVVPWYLIGLGALYGMESLFGPGLALLVLLAAAILAACVVVRPSHKKLE